MNIRVNKFLNIILIFVKYLPPIIGIGLIFLILPHSIKLAKYFQNYEEFKEILKIIIWPLIILFLLLSFRKIFDYLFLSLRQFNFFGFMGELRPVDEVIKEEAQKLLIQEKLEEFGKLKKEDILSYSKSLYEENLYLKNEIKNLETKSDSLQRVLQYIKNLGMINFVQAGVEFNATTTPSAATINPQNDYTVWQNSVIITTRAVDMTRISFRKTGSVKDADLQNFRLYVDGVQVGSAIPNLALNSNNESLVTFDLTSSPKRLEAGTRVVKLLADIVEETAIGKDFTFSLESQDDIDLFDSTTYMKIEPTTINQSLFSKRITGTQTIVKIYENIVM